MDENKKVPLLSKLCYGCGGASSNILSMLAGTFLLSYYTDTALMGVAAVSTMLMVVRIFDGFTDVVMGGIVDKTNTRWGKARPWLLVSAPFMTIGIVLLFNVPMGLSDSGKLIYAYLTYIFIMCIVYTVFAIAHAALLARMTMDYNDRTVVTTISSVFQTIIAIIVGSATTGMVAKHGWKWTSIVFGVAAGILILIAFWGVNERVGIDENTGKAKTAEVPFKDALPIALKNRYFYLCILIGIFTLLMNANSIASIIFYCNHVIGDPTFIATLMSVGQIPGLLIMFVIPYIANKFGKRAFMMGGAIIMIIGFVLMGLANGNRTMALIGVVLKSIALSPIFTGIFAFIGDATDYGEWKFGVRTEGLMSSSQSVGQKIGIGLGSGITGWVLAAGGYDGAAAVQSASAIAAIKFVFGWLGAILSICMLITILFMDVEKYMPQIRKDLLEKHAKE